MMFLNVLLIDIDNFILIYIDRNCLVGIDNNYLSWYRFILFLWCWL